MHCNYFILYFFIIHFALIVDVNFSNSIQNCFSQPSNAKNSHQPQPFTRCVFRTLSKSMTELFYEKNYLVFIGKDSIVRSNPPKVLLGKGILKTSSKFTEKYPYWSAISINLLYTLTRVSSWNLLHVFRPPFCKNTYERLLLSLRFLTGSYIHLCLHNILTLLKKYLSVFSPNTGKYGPKQLRIRALFKQRNSFEISQISLEIAANK